MRFATVIDRSLLRRLDAEPGRVPAFRAAADVPAALRELLEGKSTGPLGTLVFVPRRNLRRVLALLKTVSSRDLLPWIVVLDPASGGPGAPPAHPAVAEYRRGKISRAEFRFIVRRAEEALRRSARRKRRDGELKLTLKDTDRDQEDLINIGRALSTEKNIDVLFRMILQRAMKITGADAGTIYIVEGDRGDRFGDRDGRSGAGGRGGATGGGEKRIRVKYSETFSRAINFEESVLPYSGDTIAGYVALTGLVLNIPDVTRLPPDSPVRYNARYDVEHGYRTKSMLVVPMRDHGGAVIGVIQLINSKENHLAAARAFKDAGTIVLETPEDYDRYVVPFARRYNRLLEAVAGQAAIAIENARMVEQIKHQFEEFVKASVFAIESRDEATSGHSFRVAALCLRLADAINRRRSGPFRDVEFSEARLRELEYAALLHDYGKVYMDMRVFRKAKKLHPEDYEKLMRKIEIAWRQAEIAALLREKELLSAPTGADRTAVAALEEERRVLRERIETARERIRVLNEPSVSKVDPASAVEETGRLLEAFRCTDLDGLPVTLLDERERACLAIERGSLTGDERREIEGHVEHTYNFVSKIPWPADLARIPEIARAHHEMLDGSGYPRRLAGRERIPLEARIMAIADIYDALTAKDRPYKKAVPADKALRILAAESAAGRIDPDLFALFTEERLWEDAPARS